jgi:SHS2 domain-containing protein
MRTLAGFREHEHTADWELEVWAPDLPSLLEEAARGMYSLAGVHLHSKPRVTRELMLRSGDPERLLVNFLSELLYLAEQDGLGFDTFRLELCADVLQARLEGASIAGYQKEIKAVTYHNLQIQRTSTGGVSVFIVFDV